MKRSLKSIILLLPLLLLSFGCHQQIEKPPMPVPEVIVETVQVRDVQPYIKTTGTTKAFQFVEIPARVSGFLREIRYTPGEIVPHGMPLFLIQPEQYQAEVTAAEGSLASAHAQLKLMETNLARTQQLRTNNAVSQQELDIELANRDAAQAVVIRAESDLEKAKLNLSYTDVRSPITGKVDRNFVDIGNMVGSAGNFTILTTVAGMDPIYVYFDISDAQFNEVRQYAREHKDPRSEELLKRLREIKESQGSQPESVESTQTDRLERIPIPFEVSLIKGSELEAGEYPFHGIIDMASNTIDVSTGTITVRGEIPNTDYEIFPGQICRVRIPIWKISDAILVKQEAIGTDMNRRYIYVVDEKNVAHRRVIELGASQADGTRIVSKGLEKGERYIVAGIQKVRDGSTVKTAEVKTAESNASK